MSSKLEWLRQMARGEIEPPPIQRFIGYEIVSAEPGVVVLSFEAKPQHANPQGTLHGGIMCDVADAAMGLAHATTIEDETASFTTIELKINFLRPFFTGLLTATGRSIRSGRSIGYTECELTDAGGKLIAKAASTLMTMRR